MMRLIAFITSFRRESRVRQGYGELPLIDAFRERGWEVAVIGHECLHVKDGRVFGYSDDVKATVQGDVDIGTADLVWMFGFGARESFLDRMQMLNSLPSSKFVNSVDAFVFRHGKQGILLSDATFKQPKSIVSDSADVLHSHVREGGEWIVKPTAGSFGVGVCLVSQRDANVKPILELATQNGFALLQERVDTSTEKRWLTANGQVIGVYQKNLADHRGNLGSGMQPKIVENTSREEEKLIARTSRELMQLGIRYAAIDVAFPYVLDVNFVNPGWLGTYGELTGNNLAGDVAAAFDA